MYQGLSKFFNDEENIGRKVSIMKLRESDQKPKIIMKIVEAISSHYETMKNATLYKIIY